MTDQQPTAHSCGDPASGIPEAALAAVRDAAGRDGAAAADAWAHTALYALTAPERGDAARTALLRLDSGTDPDPRTGPGDIRAALADVYSAAAGADAPAFDELALAWRDTLQTVYTDTHTRVRRQHAAAHCRTAWAGPAPSDRDWSHLTQDRVRIGGIGVFAGDWAWYRDDGDRDRIRVGFVGLLIDTWNGWAVFSCTRSVAEAIVADHGRMRAEMRADEIARGLSEPDAAATVDASVSAMWFDGDTIVVDQRTVDQDPDSIERIAVRDDGSWVVMGWNWCWTVVEPGDCDTIIGELPDPDGQQQYVALTHVSGVRVPHDRLRVVASTPVDGNRNVVAYALADGPNIVGEIVDDRRIGAREVRAWDADVAAMMRGFAEQCRHFGQSMTLPQVIDALIQEYDLAQQAAHADSVGGTLIRLLDDEWRVRHVEMVIAPRPQRREALRELVRQRADITGGRTWERWTGREWIHLATVTSDTTPAG
jgi:hypothetical protein